MRMFDGEPTMRDVRREHTHDEVLPYLQLLLNAAYQWRLGIDYKFPRTLNYREIHDMAAMANLTPQELDAYIKRLERRCMWTFRRYIAAAYPAR
jgi:hypothetical protein